MYERDVQSFFQICKAKSIGGIRYIVYERIRITNIFVVFELLLPIPGIQRPCFKVWIIKQAVEVYIQQKLLQDVRQNLLLAVEPTGPRRKAWV